MQRNNQALVSIRSCPICQCAESNSVWTYKGLQYYDDGPGKAIDYCVMRCRECSALFMNPTFTDEGFKALFELAGLSYGSSEGRHQEQVDWIRAKVDLMSAQVVMDVGCFRGDFLRVFPDGIARVGLDFDEEAIRVAKELDPQGSYVQGDFEIGKWNTPTPDLITMFHVIEHVRNPKKVLSNLAAVAHPATLLCLETPVIENTVLDDVHGFFSPQHLTHFSRESLRRLLSESEWRVLAWEEMEGYNGSRVLLGLEGEMHPQSSVKIPQSRASEPEIHLTYLSNWLKKVSEVEAKLQQIEPGRLLIWGAGMHTEILFHLTSFGRIIDGATLVDSDPQKIGKVWRGLEIKDPRLLPSFGDFACLIISSYGNQDDIAREAISLGVTEDAILRLYDDLHVY